MKAHSKEIAQPPSYIASRSYLPETALTQIAKPFSSISPRPTWIRERSARFPRSSNLLAPNDFHP